MRRTQQKIVSAIRLPLEEAMTLRAPIYRGGETMVFLLIMTSGRSVDWTLSWSVHTAVQVFTPLTIFLISPCTQDLQRQLIQSGKLWHLSIRKLRRLTCLQEGWQKLSREVRHKQVREFSTKLVLYCTNLVSQLVVNSIC